MRVGSMMAVRWRTRGLHLGGRGSHHRLRKGGAAMTSPRTTGVWISANFATMLRRSPELTVRHRIDSTVPGRHRSTGRPPTEEHPGGEGHRNEHMRTFLDQVAHAVAVDDDLLLVGDGEVVG